MAILKKIGKFFGYLFGLPLIIVVIAVYAAVGIVILFVLAIKSIVLFFQGKNIYDPLPEDIEAKRILENLKNGSTTEEKESVTVEVVTNPNPYITKPEESYTPISNDEPDYIDLDNEPSQLSNESNDDIEQIPSNEEGEDKHD